MSGSPPWTPTVFDGDARLRPWTRGGAVFGYDELVALHLGLATRDQALARELGGYGTLRGLALSITSQPGGPAHLRISAGVAIDAAGRLVAVPAPQTLVVAHDGSASPLNRWVCLSAAPAREGDRWRDGFALTLTSAAPTGDAIALGLVSVWPDRAEIDESARPVLLSCHALLALLGAAPLTSESP